MTRYKIHAKHPNELHVALCNFRITSPISFDGEGVDCKRCLRLLEKRRRKP